MGSLVADAAQRAVIDLLGMLMEGLGLLISALMKVCTAHTVLLSLLLLSATANFFYTSRDTWAWWGERNAVTFMKNIGVGMRPNDAMSRAIYVKDLDDAVTDLTADVGVALDVSVGGQEAERGPCYDTFLELVQGPFSSGSHGADIPYTSASTALSSQRLQRTRQNLASYRHDLLVSMRIVNRVEREVLQAEWETWVKEEGRRCKKVGEMVKKNETMRRGEMVQWYEGYCGSCRREMEGLERSARL